MIDATILIPTHDHAATLPVAIRSALEQRGVSFELFIVGDGVGEDTREVMKGYANDHRVRFFDLPKGERRGERNRHVALQESRGGIVCYLSDDDILLPWHVEEMKRLLADVDFAHSAAVLVDPDGALVFRPGDLARPEFRALIEKGTNNFVSLTGAAHTSALYARLPHGWHPAPPDLPTDIHMWLQVFALRDVRAATSPLLTSIHFPDPAWSGEPLTARTEALQGWLERALLPDGESELQEALDRAIRREAEKLKLRSIEQSHALEVASREVDRLRTPIWRRVARRAFRSRSLRELRQRLSRVSAVP